MHSRQALRLLRWEMPRMVNALEQGLDWAGLPVIATVARLLCPTRRNPAVTPSRGGSRSRGRPGAVGQDARSV